jgi:hypothetical protein
MKLHEIYKSIINEIGEGSSKPFPYDLEIKSTGQELAPDEFIYEHTAIIDAEANGEPLKIYLFLTENEYNEPPGGKPDELEVSFKTPKGNFDDVINDRVYLFRLMATITEIIKRMIKARNIGRISFEPAKGKGEKSTSAIDTKRSKLYLAFMRKAFPSAKVEEFEDEVIITL